MVLLKQLLMESVNSFFQQLTLLINGDQFFRFDKSNFNP